MAASVNTPLGASAQVNAKCKMNASDDLGFGEYDPTSGNPAQVTGNINVQCTKGTHFWPYVQGVRTLVDGVKTIAFQIGASAYGPDDFASDVGGATEQIAPNASNIAIPLYGQIDANLTDTEVGTYSAALTAVVDY
jgi:spore coat protein U-like protein